MHRSWRYAPPPPSLSPVVPLPPLLSLGCHFVAHCRARDEPVVPPAHQASRTARALRTRRLHASARHPAGIGRTLLLVALATYAGRFRTLLLDELATAAGRFRTLQMVELASRARLHRRDLASLGSRLQAVIGRCCWLRSQHVQAVFGRCCWSSSRPLQAVFGRCGWLSSPPGRAAPPGFHVQAVIGRCCLLSARSVQAVFGRCCWSSCTSPAGGGRLRTLGAASRAGSPRATGTRASSQASAIDHASGIFWRDALV